MNARLRGIAACALITACAGCSWFGSSGPKIAKLTDIPNAVPVQRLWQASLPNPMPDVLVPAVAEGSVFAAGGETLARFDVKSGKEIWRVKLPQRITGGVGSDGRVVVVGTGKGVLFCYQADGKQAWTVELSSEVLSPPAVAGNLVVVRTSDNRIYGLDVTNGKRLWLMQRASPALIARSRAEAVIVGNTVYAGFAGGKLVAINAQNGALQWEGTVSVPRGATELERISDVTSPPVVVDGVACAVAFQGKLSCFDAGNGNPLWSRDVSSTTGIAMDVRYVFVSDDKAVLYAYDRATGASMWKTNKLSLRQLSTPVSQGRFVVVGDLQGYIHFINREDGSLSGRIATDGNPIVADMKTSDQVLVAQTRKGAVFAVQAQ